MCSKTQGYHQTLPIETTYKLNSPNKASIYIYGTEDEAIRYLELINSKIHFGLYQMEESGLTDEQAEDIAMSLSQLFIDIDDVDDDETN